MWIDLRSDTVTRPTRPMLEAMFSAQVGDDVYQEDETVNALQEKVAAMFGMEAALFCPSGTMTNQIAIRSLTQPQDEVICYEGAHIYKYEGGGLMANSGVSVKLLAGQQGKLSPEAVQANINPDNIHFPVSRVVALENSVNRAGGSVYQLAEIQAIAELARAHDLKMHLDGARVFNALQASNTPPVEYGKYFDTISVCLSKGLGCPVGSVLLGSQEMIQKALRIRKVMGGGMRQAGYLAAAGIYALDHHIQRLAEDHQRAKTIAEHLAQQSYVVNIMPVETNIVIFEMENEEIVQEFIRFCAEHQVKLGTMAKLHPRIVTHLDFGDAMLERFLEVLDRFPQ